MKTIFLFFLSIVCLNLKAQTAEEIIEKYTKAMGGLEAFNKIQTAKITGSLQSQGLSFPITVYISNGKSMRSDVNVNGQTVTNAYDQGKGWKLNPFENITTATEVTSQDDLALLKLQASLANNLMDYKKRGHSVEFIGQEDVDGVKANKIKLISKDDGKTTIFFISTADNLLVRSDSKQKIQGNEYDAETYYTNFRDFQNLKFSTHFVRKIQGNVFQEVDYETIEFNVPVDASIFKLPK